MDLSTDGKACIANTERVSNNKLKLQRVIQQTLSEYQIQHPITEKLCATFRIKLWRMGQRLCTAGSIKRKTVIESWKTGANTVWELQLNIVSENKKLAKKCKGNMEELQLTKSKLDEEAKNVITWK